MMNLKIERPEQSEYAPSFAGYVSLVPEGDIVAMLEKQLSETLKLLSKISDSDALFRYAPEKWSIKGLVGHLIDSERVFAYRALCIARGEIASLPGFDENEYLRNANFDERSLADLAAEFDAVRRSTVLLFKSFDRAAWSRTGIANENPASVRALAFAVAGHELHHRRILRDRYLQSERLKNGA